MYASALLDCVDFLSDGDKLAFTSSNRFLSSNYLKARLNMIVNEQLDYRFGWKVRVLLGVAAALILPTSAHLQSQGAESASTEQVANESVGAASELVGQWRVTACTFAGRPDGSVIGDVHTILKDRMVRPNRRTQYRYSVDGERGD